MDYIDKKSELILAVERLLTTIDEEYYCDSLASDVNAVVAALGYNPVPQAQLYEVSLIIEYDARTPEEAVQLFIESVEEDCRHLIYLVKDEAGNIVEIDPYSWKRN
jgi:hypothetical protein